MSRPIHPKGLRTVPRMQREFTRGSSMGSPQRIRDRDRAKDTEPVHHARTLLRRKRRIFLEGV